MGRGGRRRSSLRTSGRRGRGQLSCGARGRRSGAVGRSRQQPPGARRRYRRGGGSHRSRPRRPRGGRPPDAARRCGAPLRQARPPLRGAGIRRGRVPRRHPRHDRRRPRDERRCARRGDLEPRAAGGDDGPKRASALARPGRVRDRIPERPWSGRGVVHARRAGLRRRRPRHGADPYPPADPGARRLAADRSAELRFRVPQSSRGLRRATRRSLRPQGRPRRWCGGLRETRQLHRQRGYGVSVGHRGPHQSGESAGCAP